MTGLSALAVAAASCSSSSDWLVEATVPDQIGPDEVEGCADGPGVGKVSFSDTTDVVQPSAWEIEVTGRTEADDVADCLRALNADVTVSRR